MKTYESSQKRILRNINDIYDKLSNLKNIEPALNQLPNEYKEKVKDVSVDSDSITFSIDPIGNITIRIVDKTEPKMLKFGAENFPIDFNFWIQLVSVDMYDTRMKLTLKADVPLMLRPMIGNKLDKGIEQVADMITMAFNR